MSTFNPQSHDRYSKKGNDSSWSLSSILVVTTIAAFAVAQFGGAFARYAHDRNVGAIPDAHQRAYVSFLGGTARAETRAGSSEEYERAGNSTEESRSDREADAQSRRIDANRGIYTRVIETEVPRATPNVKKLVEAIQMKPHVMVTNICGQFGRETDIGHRECASVDIPLASLPDRPAAEAWVESQGFVCDVHANGSDDIVPIESEWAHLHCMSIGAYGITLPAHFEPWKHAIALDIAKKAREHGLSPMNAVAAAIVETGLTPASIGDHGCSVGVYQWNTCARGDSPDDTIDAWMDEIAHNKERFGGDEMRAIVRWNFPRAAEEGFYKNTKYHEKLRKVLNEISS